MQEMPKPLQSAKGLRTDGEIIHWGGDEKGFYFVPLTTQLDENNEIRQQKN